MTEFLVDCTIKRSTILGLVPERFRNVRGVRAISFRLKLSIVSRTHYRSRRRFINMSFVESTVRVGPRLFASSDTHLRSDSRWLRLQSVHRAIIIHDLIAECQTVQNAKLEVFRSGADSRRVKWKTSFNPLSRDFMKCNQKRKKKISTPNLRQGVNNGI